jgi:hypothetical protein
MARRNPLNMALSEVIGIILLVLLTVILNLIGGMYPHQIFAMIVQFFNANLVFLILLSLVFFVGDLFAVFGFPVNVPAPIFRAIASVMLVAFIFRVLRLLEEIAGESVFSFVYMLAPFIYMLVFLLVIVLGYLSLFSRSRRRKERRGLVRREPPKTETSKKLEEYKEETREGDIKDAVTTKKKSSKKKVTKKKTSR